MKLLRNIVVLALLLSPSGCSDSSQQSKQNRARETGAKAETDGTAGFSEGVTVADSKQAVGNVLGNGANAPLPICTLDGKCALPAEVKHEADRQDMQEKIEKKSIDAAQEKLKE